MERNSSSRDEATLILDMWLVSHLASRLVDDDLRPLGLTGDEFGLYCLIHAAGPATPTQISRWTGMAATTVSGMLRRITARGHLEDVPNPDDARSRLIRLSDEGLSVTARAAEVLARSLPSLERALNGQRAIRAKLGNLDDGLRRLEVTPRPGATKGSEPLVEQPAISYGGPRLTWVQTDEVCAFIDWLRTRDFGRLAVDSL